MREAGPARSDSTRAAIIEAASQVFADKGFEAGSLREITRRAGTNIAAVAYHFGGKDALHVAVLRAAIAELDAIAIGEDAESFAAMGAEEALRRFVGRQLSIMLRREEVARALRLIDWEILGRSLAFQELMASGQLPIMRVAEGIARRFLRPGSPPEDVTLATLWLLNQGFAFVRSCDSLERPPANICVDAAFVDRLSDRLVRGIAAALPAFSIGPAEQGGEAPAG